MNRENLVFAVILRALTISALSLPVACEDTNEPSRASEDVVGDVNAGAMTDAGELAGMTSVTPTAGITDDDAGDDMNAHSGGGASTSSMGGVEPPAPPPEDCVSDLDFFETQVWRPVIKPLCLDCHNPQGAAQSTDMVYAPEDQLNALETNYGVFVDIASFDRDGAPLVLLKPTHELAHGGGELLRAGDESYQALATMVERARAGEPVVCEEEIDIEDNVTFDGIKLLDAHATLYRASLSLAGRLPTASELDLVSEYGWSGVEAALNQILHSERFYIRLKELWNDILLTDKYLGNNNAIDLLNPEQFPNARWHIDGVNQQRDEAYWAAVDYANTSLAREALEHISFVVREGRPFHEVITADYIAMNPFTARIHGVTDIEWDDPLDPKEFRPGRTPDVPHAGILSSPMFLNRFPTTDTNRNRHRARIFFKLFLDLDVFKIAERPIDPTSTAHNPTMNDPQCSICHTVIDPVAGAFQHWDTQGSFVFRDAWYGDMRAPGFMGVELPFDDRQASLRWLALRASEDERFDRSITRLMYQALIGDDFLGAPSEGSHLEERQASFEAQQRFINQISAGFRANRHDLRWLIKALVRSPYYRVVGVEDGVEVDEALSARWAHLGFDKPMIPEQLNRKLYATTGARWRPNVTSRDYLANAEQYRLLYGGIDSDDVVERIRTPNGIFTNIQRRMANEVGCRVSAYDFTKAPEDRFLFPWVEPSFEPIDINGFDVPQVQELIRLNLQHLVWSLWGERWELDAPELDELYQLWTDLWTLGQEDIAEGIVSTGLAYSCSGQWDLESGAGLSAERLIRDDSRFTIRAWRGVLTVLLNDSAFLYE